MNFLPATIRATMTLWFGGALAVVLLLFAAGVYLLVRASVLGQVGERVRQDLARATTFVRDNPGDIDEFFEFAPDALVLIVKDGRVEYRAEAWDRLGLPRPEQLRVEPAPWLWEAPGDEHYRIAATPVDLGEHQAVIAIAENEQSARASVNTVGWIMGFGVPVVLVAGGICGYRLAGRMLAPIRRMADAAERIGAERLDERLPVENPRDEFGRLATITNRSLDRLADALERQRRFTSDASHEMRTPLTAIRSTGEVALRREQEPEQYREAIGAMLEATTRLTTLIDHLLALARADAGTATGNPERIGVVDVIRECVELLSPAAEEKGLSIDVSGEPASIQVDPLLFRQSVLNVLDNAIKYSPRHPDGLPVPAIAVSVRTDGRGQILISVTDQGPGIAPEHVPHIFDRFYRADPARAGDGSALSAGLGLALVKWAVGACGGVVEVESTPGRGSTFTLLFPAAGASAGADHHHTRYQEKPS